VSKPKTIKYPRPIGPDCTDKERREYRKARRAAITKAGLCAVSVRLSIDTGETRMDMDSAPYTIEDIEKKFAAWIAPYKEWQAARLATARKTSRSRK
jgi:hypothetical protein